MGKNKVKIIIVLSMIIVATLSIGTMKCQAKTSEDNYGPFSQKRVYVFHPNKSLNLETDIYFTEKQKKAIEEDYTSVEAFLGYVYNMEWAHSTTTVDYLGTARVKKKKVHHYFVEVDIINKKHDFNEDFWVDYNTLVLESDKKKVSFWAYYLENFMEEYVEDNREEYAQMGTQKCGEAFYIRYPYKVKDANGKIQSDGYTVKYTCLIGKNKMETQDDSIWATFWSGAKKRVAINRTKLVLGAGTTYKLKMTGTTAKKWSSSNVSVAKVSGRGKVTTKQAGTATITCKGANGKNYKCKIVVQ